MNPFAALGVGLVLGLRDATDAACMSHSGQEPPRNQVADSGRSIALSTQSGQLAATVEQPGSAPVAMSGPRVWLDERAIDLLAFHAETRCGRMALGMVSSPPVSRSGVVEITAR